MKKSRTQPADLAPPAGYPVITKAEANADRIARARRHASHCLLMARVTSPDVAASLIDRAIELSISAGDAAPGERVPTQSSRRVQKPMPDRRRRRS